MHGAPSLSECASYAGAIASDLGSCRVVQGDKRKYWFRKSIDVLSFAGALPESVVKRVAPTGQAVVDTGEGRFPIRLQSNDARLTSSFYEHRFKPYLPDGADTMIDVGAYIGLYEVRAANAGFSSVHAFEPCDENRHQLRETIGLNSLEDLVVVNDEAVTDREGQVGFSEEAFHVGRNEVDDSAPRVASTTLDSYIEESAISVGDVAYVKVDVEDASTRALRGATEKLSMVESGSRLQVEFKSERAYLDGDALLRSLDFEEVMQDQCDYLYEKGYSL